MRLSSVASSRVACVPCAGYPEMETGGRGVFAEWPGLIMFWSEVGSGAR